MNLWHIGRQHEVRAHARSTDNIEKVAKKVTEDCSKYVFPHESVLESVFCDNKYDQKHVRQVYCLTRSILLLIETLTLVMQVLRHSTQWHRKGKGLGW